MEPAWEETLRELRAEYIVGARAKAEEASRLVAHLASDPADRQSLSDVMRRFHGLAGSGTTYGFPRVSEIALGAERTCGELLAAGEGPGLPHLDRLRGAAASILDHLDPALAVPPGDLPAPAAPEPATGPATRRVLVVDGDAAARADLRPLLEREGLIVEEAASLAEAVAQVDRRLPDAIVLAAALADGAGHPLIRHVRVRPRGDAMPIVMLGTRAGFLDTVGAIQSGADAFFDKPVDGARVVHRLLDLLERQREHAARILCVEDDASQAAFLRAVLQSAGYEVDVCADPRRFESSMASYRPDLVLMDLMLPGVSGHDLVRYVRQDERYAPLPVIVVTTESRAAAEMETMRAGADDHLTKPVPPGLLLSAVAARLERARALKAQLDRDGLTRLLTRSALLDRARTKVALKSRVPGRATAWVMLDLDRFKEVNERYGHPIGDRVLAALSALLRRRLRQSDTVGRYGGEEFGLLLDDLRPEDAVRLVERLREEFRAFEFTAPGGTPFHATFSAGIAMLGASMDVDAWQQAAADALSAAKRAGGTP